MNKLSYHLIIALFCLILSSWIGLSANAQVPAFDSDKPAVSFNSEYGQTFNTTEGWNNPKFYNQWSTLVPYTFFASDISSGYLQFKWIEKRVICSKKVYSQPNVFETEIDYAAGSNRGGVVIRGRFGESLQEPNTDPGFNREGIAFYPTLDGSSMTVQFSGVDMGAQGNTAIVRILVPKPVGITSLLNRGKLRIEDFGSTIYVYYNGAPFIRIDLGDKTESIYSSGTVYNSDMQVLGTFAGMEVDITGKVAIAERDATLRLYSAKINYNDVVEPPIDTTVFESVYRDLHADTWVATDALGRTMPSFDEVGPVKEDKNRFVSIFYITWHTEDNFTNFKTPYSADVSKILNTDPGARLDANNPLWTAGSYHWGEPEMGYFLSQDEYVIRKDMAMLSNAGVDVIVLDVTNAVRYWDEWEVLLNTMHKMRAEGNKVPKFCFWAFNGPVISVVQDLYDQIYKDPRYKDLWFYWDGKPLLLYNGIPNYSADGQIVKNPNPHYDPGALTDVNNPHYGDPDYTSEFYSDYTKEVKDFFTKRPMWWGYYEWAGNRYIGTEDNWSFGYDLADGRVKSMNPNDLVSKHNGQKEEAAVTPAQHPSSLVGKSWQRSTGEPQLNEYDKPVTAFVPWLGKTVNNPEGYGIYFQDRWDEAIGTDPDMIYINDWNEWTAGKYPAPNGGSTPFMRRDNPFFFVDQYNEEFNRCISPMKDGYTDNYYMQMAQNIRKYKGIRPGPGLQVSHTITIDGKFDDWNAVVTEFLDAQGDVIHRNHNGYGGLHYTNETSRNDIITSKVAFDDQNLSFYVKTAQNLSPSTDPNWMLLFIDADRNKGTGWEGYDYVINLGVKSSTETTLKQWDGQNWSYEVRVPYKIAGNEMEVSVPRTAIKMDTAIPEFYFHWSDNAQQLKNITCFFTDGESAPDRRFDYNFSTSKILKIPQSPYKTLDIPGIIEFEDFDNGGAGVAYVDATIGNSGGAYRPNESVDIEAKTGGGYDIGWINSGEWLEYTVNVKALGKYSASINYAANSDGKEAVLYFDKMDKSGVISFPSTGNSDTWSTKVFDIQLTAGKHTMKFFIKNAANDFKLDNIVFTEKDVVYPGNGTGLNRTLWKGSAPGTWFKDSICSEIDPVIDEVWASTDSPGCSISNTFWNARYQGEIQALYTETYTFYLTIRDMARLWVNAQLLIDKWSGSGLGSTFTVTINLKAGEKVPIRVDFAKKTSDGKLKLEWSSASNPREVVPQSQLYPSISTGLSPDSKMTTISVYPNPTYGQITINTRQYEASGFRIIDLLGRTVFQCNEKFTGIKTIDLSLTKGIYFMNLTGSVKFATQKLIIE